MRMMRTILSARSLGIACLILGAGDTILRMTHILVAGEPLGLFGIFGLGLLLRRGAFKKFFARGVIFASGLTFAWSVLITAVFLLARPSDALSPMATITALAGYLAVSIIFGLWGWIVLKQLEST